MTPTRLRHCLILIGWSQRALADRLGLHDSVAHRWASGRYPVPENVARWLERLAKGHARAPLPEGWAKDADHD